MENKKQLIKLLEELQEYMHNLADTVDVEGEYNRGVPNQEAVFYCEISDALYSLKLEI